MDAAQTMDKAEKAYNQRLKYAEVAREIQEEIERMETEVR